MAFLELTKKKASTLNPYFVYLDSCSTYNQVINDNLVTNIRETGKVLKGHCNAGTTSTSKQGDLGSLKMWINGTGIANIISIPVLEKNGFRVSYDTNAEWVIHSPEGKEIIFKRDTGVCDMMPYIDLRENHEGLMMVQTIRQNYEGYT